ncbi:MAG TPA: hypothetical protein VFA33_02945 [Bryobacteraceae bacterium]|nr:hypothetical protein [Bryobacteraceae bacterium]
MDNIGRISVPTLVDSGLTFPLTSDFGYGFSQDRPVVVHQFGELDAKAEQRYAVGLGPRRFAFRRQHLSMRDRASLVSFWEALQGAWKSFTYNAPNPDQTTTPTKVTWEYAPLAIQYLTNACQTGFNFIEVPDPTAAPNYAVNSTCLRFPSAALQSALLSQVQQIIPLVHIRVRESAVPDIYLSDRRVTVAGQLFLPRVLGIGEPGSDVIISQDIKGTADNVQFTFGNADRVMTQLANDTDLKYAQIDLSLFHVNSGILLQLWSGFIISFVADGSPQFTAQCSDGLYQITQMYPVRAISRQCWKTFNDGVNCPYAAHGSGGDPASCDYYFDSANGCQAHGMTQYFGGHPAAPQGVVIKDNSTGLWGFGRSTVTATSIISDTIWGNALQEIWCNDDGDPGKAFWVNCMIAAGRDESDFYDALGIVGAGPIGRYTGMLVYQNADGYRYIIAPMLDGQPPHGFKVDGGLNVISDNPTMGLREVAGADPQTDSFSLGQGTPQVWGPQRAAGTAFVEIRRTDQSGIQPSTTDQHQMQVPISQGLTGWTWDQNGNRTAVTGLTNPFWIAVNSLLRALGVAGALSGTQLNRIVLPSLVVGDGSGAAEIADTLVTPVVGSGVEKQFRFQGVIAQQKPFRDWLVEILACGLGFFTWEFGKLKVGCRINASAVDAFTLGNILFQSLRLEPIDASFEHLIIDFADQAYQYQANTAEYQDKSHAAYFGRAGAPLTARQHLVGCATISQALRLAATRTREEIGGVNAAEWRNARAATWKTTLLGLNNEVGQVVSMTHLDVPGMKGTCSVTSGQCGNLGGDPLDKFIVNKEVLINGVQCTVTQIFTTPDYKTVTGFAVSPAPADSSNATFRFITADFRIQSWRLHKDWSVTMAAKTVTASMYDLDVGPKPLDVTPAPLPALFYPIPLGPAWAPYQIQARGDDALFPGEWTFDTNQSYAQMADGSMLANLVITGKLPVNSFSPGVGAPVAGSITVNTAGGSLAGGTTIRLSLCALDSNGLPSVPMPIAIVPLPAGGSTCSIVLNSIVWPAVAVLKNYVIFAAAQDDLICGQQLGTYGGVVASGALTPTGDGTVYTPETITFTGPLLRSTFALPSPYVSKVRLKAKHLIHGGIIGATVDSVSAGVLVCGSLKGAPPSSNASFTPVGRIISIIGRPETATPYFSGRVTSWDQATGTIGVTPDPNGIVQEGDCFVLRFNADASNTTSPTAITDSGCQNIVYPNGMTSGAEVGNLIRVIQGASRGTPPRKIIANTATSITWDIPMVINPGDVWIIEEATWPYSYDTTSFSNADPLASATINMPTNNFVDTSLLISGFTIDVNGNESPDGDAPIREDWVFGAEGLSKVAGLVFQMQGTLGIESNAAQPLYLNRPVTAGDVKGYVQAAPTGSGITFTVYVGGAAWLTLTIPAGQTAVVATPSQISALTEIPANTAVSIGITAVGTTFPGSNLSVFIYS